MQQEGSLILARSLIIKILHNSISFLDMVWLIKEVHLEIFSREDELGQGIGFTELLYSSCKAIEQ
jgi:hypothetical protein